MKIYLKGACILEPCLQMAKQLHEQLDEPRYRDSVAVMEMPEDAADWLLDHRTARKRAARSRRLGYEFRPIRREDHEQEIFAINTSKEERQGRPMSDGYHKPPSFSPLKLDCAHHHVYTYGVFGLAGTLVAYMWLYRCHELAMVSSLLGHGDHLDDDVMYLLFAGVIGEQTKLGGTMFYNRFDSGTEGLRYFKNRIGFRPDAVVWAL